MSDNVSIVGETIAADEVTIDGALAKVQRVKVVHGVAGSGVDASGSNPLPVADSAVAAALATLQGYVDGLEGLLAHGTFAYASGTATGTVDVPAGARLKRVSVVAGASAGATVTIAGGSTITIPAGASFDEEIAGDVTAGGDVVIGGTVQSYYVSWVA
jgi:hypothetical protein